VTARIGPAAAALALAAAACRAPPLEGSVAPRSYRSTDAGVDSADAAGRDAGEGEAASESAFCREVRERRDRVLRELRASADGGPLPSCLEPPAILGSCAQDGPWAFLLESARAAPGGPGTWGDLLSVRWSLVHGDAADPARLFLATPTMTSEHRMPDLAAEPANVAHDCYDALTIADPEVFDWDGDGDPEILVRMSVTFHEAGTWTHGRLWTFRDGRVTLYPPARSFSVLALEDVDGDGRPDVWTHGPYSAKGEWPGSGFDFSLEGPRLLAHSLRDGSFSLDDATATAAVRAQCAAAPGAIVPAEGKDESDAALSVVCARLRGESAADVRARIERECRAVRQSRRCVNAGAWRDLASAVPPLRLR
jgi:hypothetical protein